MRCRTLLVSSQFGPSTASMEGPSPQDRGRSKSSSRLGRQAHRLLNSVASRIVWMWPHSMHPESPERPPKPVAPTSHSIPACTSDTAGLHMDARVVSDVAWPRLASAGGQGGQPFAQVTHGQHRPACGVGVSASVQRGGVLGVAVAFQRGGLARRHNPRICSEADVRYESVERKRRS